MMEAVGVAGGGGGKRACVWEVGRVRGKRTSSTVDRSMLRMAAAVAAPSASAAPAAPRPCSHSSSDEERGSNDGVRVRA